ncbi:MAG: tyrosine-type recombinase/integrase [Proteobacteria bacterium]|nr:tyrosine-type recombinase/integrase [Pseudomonadota bacterium]
MPDRAPVLTGKQAAQPPQTQAERPMQRRGRPRGAKSRLLREGAGQLGRHHFAFLRALLDGIGLERAWELYLAFAGGAGDRRHIAARLRRTVASVERAGAAHESSAALAVALPALRALPDFAAARSARRAGKAGHIAEDEVGVGLPDTRAPSPSLDSWRSQYCAACGIDEDFYTEAEWIALYGDEFGSAAAGVQRTAGKAGHLPAASSPAAPPPALSAVAHVRLAEESEAARGRHASAPAPGAVVEALQTLERALSREARLDDGVGFWLGSALPRDLAKVGVESLGDLVECINLHGFRWHRHVPRVGGVRARRLVEWLAPIAAAGGRPLGESARRPETDLAMLRARALARPALPGAEPAPFAPVFERVAADSVPARAQAARRMPAPAAGWPTDFDAIAQWLGRFRGQTRRDYVRIAERFWLWCSRVRRKGLAALEERDLRAYQAFVAAPPADWVQARQVRREDAAWRPFRGPLGSTSRRHELTVLGSLFSALHKAGYLRCNAMADLAHTLEGAQPVLDVQRSFDARQWSFAMRVLHEKPDTPERRRLQLLLELGSTTGLRLSELATTRWRGLRRERVDGQDVWLLDVVGNAGRTRSVVVFDDVRALLEQHQRDMDAAGLGFDARVQRIQAPGAAPGGAADRRRADTGGGTDGRLGPAAHARPHDGPHDEVRGEPRDAWRPLVGILRRPPPRRDLDPLGVPFVDRERPSQADRYGALERSGIYKLLRRFFRDVAHAAASRDGAPDPGGFLSASTHWLRHTFARNVVGQVQPQVLQRLLGHSDLRLTSAYMNADEADLVRGMRALQRGPGEPGESVAGGRAALERTPPG